jgi:hypothetical protein
MRVARTTVKWIIVVYKEVSIKIAPAASSKRDKKFGLRDFFLKSGDCARELIAQKRGALIVSARI